MDIKKESFGNSNRIYSILSSLGNGNLAMIQLDTITTADFLDVITHTKPSAKNLSQKYTAWQREFESVWQKKTKPTSKSKTSKPFAIQNGLWRIKWWGGRKCCCFEEQNAVLYCKRSLLCSSQREIFTFKMKGWVKGGWLFFVQNSSSWN